MKKQIVSQSRRAIAAVIVACAMIHTAGMADQAPPNDPLAPLGKALTRCVTGTRGDAGLDDKALTRTLNDARNTLVRLVVDTSATRPTLYEDDVHLHADLGDMLSTFDVALHLMEHGDKHTAHHGFKGARLQLAFVRSRNGVVDLGDMAWRYNCAFHPMMHEIMHAPKNAAVTPEQIEVCRRATRGAAMALAALDAVAQQDANGENAELNRLIAACKKSLTDLQQELADHRPEKVKPKVKALRQCFIDLMASIAR